MRERPEWIMFGVGGGIWAEFGQVYESDGALYTERCISKLLRNGNKSTSHRDVNYQDRLVRDLW